MKVTAQLYGQFLLSSQVNYTGTYLADHLESLPHDNVQYFLKSSRFAPRQVWQQVRHQIQLADDGYVLFDDTVLSKVHSHKIELVRRQYSGNAHGIIKGIGLVNCVYFNPHTNQFWLLDYRIFNPTDDGKSKIDHVLDMLGQLAPRQIGYQTVLMDSWYAVTQLFKWLIEAGKPFYRAAHRCPLKSNRKVDDSGGERPYQPVECLSWSAQEVQGGKLVKVHKMPQTRISNGSEYWCLPAGRTTSSLTTWLKTTRVPPRKKAKRRPAASVGRSSSFTARTNRSPVWSTASAGWGAVSVITLPWRP